jgi:hypothetical protein
MIPATHITAFDFILLTAVFMIAGMLVHFWVTKKEHAHDSTILGILILPAVFGAIRWVFILGSFFIAMGSPAYTAGTPTLCQDGSYTHVQAGDHAGSECSGEGGVLKYNVSNYRKSPAYNPSPDGILAARAAAHEASVARREAVIAQRNAAAARKRARHARYLRIRRGIRRRTPRRRGSTAPAASAYSPVRLHPAIATRPHPTTTTRVHPTITTTRVRAAAAHVRRATVGGLDLRRRLAVTLDRLRHVLVAWGNPIGESLSP